MENFLQIAVFVTIGMIFRRVKSVPDETPHVFNMFVLYVALPAIILLEVPHLKLNSETLVVALFPWLMMLFTALLVWGIARTRGWSRSVTGVLLLVVPLGNTGFLGLPMVDAFFGTAGVPFAIVYDQMATPLLATYGTLIIVLYGQKRVDGLFVMALKSLFFPPTIALIIGFAMRGSSYPPILEAALESAAATLVPLVMTAIGYQLSLQVRPTNLAPFGFGLAIKLLVAPLVSLLVLQLFGLDGLAYDVAIFESAMPPMVVASIMAISAGMDSDLAVAMVGLGTICSFVTLPLLSFLIL